MSWKKAKKIGLKPRIRTGGKIFEWKVFQYLRYLITGLIAFVFKIWWMTLRIRASDESLNIVKKTRSPATIVFWHNHLFIAAYWAKVRPKGKLYAMMSAGTIGSWISPFYENFNIKAIRGSTNLRATQGLKEVVQIVYKGNDIAITPDGSRGPCYQFKAGAALVLKMADPAIIFFSCKFHNAWRLKTWDHFYLPKPFSKVECIFHYISTYKELTNSDDIQTIKEALNRELMNITYDVEYEKK